MYWYCYDIDEVCALYRDFGLHPQTVRQWIKNGLPTADGGKPSLIYGYDLKKYIGKQNLSGQYTTAFEHMPCFKCREGKPPYMKRITLEHVHGSIRAKGHCQTCKGLMNKNYKLDDIPRLRAIFDVVDVLELYDSTASPVNTHIPPQPETHVSEPAQWELFAR